MGEVHHDTNLDLVFIFPSVLNIIILHLCGRMNKNLFHTFLIIYYYFIRMLLISHLHIGVLPRKWI